MCTRSRFLLTILLVTTCLDVGVQGMHTLGCVQGYQQVISYNSSLLSPSNITATDEDTNINPDDYLFHRNNVPLRLWCSRPLLNNSNNSRQPLKLSMLQHVQELSIHVNLTRAVLITQIGSSGFSNGFVNNFTLSYGISESRNTSVYAQEDLDNAQGFIVRRIDTVFTLDHPFMASWLNFQIKDGIVSPSGRICWHLSLFGCPLQYTPTPRTVVVKDYQILVIVIPTAVCTVLIVLCIVAVGVCICCYNRGNRGWKDTGLRGSLGTGTNTQRVVENRTLYKSNTPLLPLTTPEGNRTITTNDVTKHIYQNVPRELLPSKESGYYEPIRPISDDSLESNDSMVDNPTYSVPFLVGIPPSLQGPHLLRGPLPPIPQTETSTKPVGGNRIAMVNNECYRTPKDTDINSIQSFPDKLPNDYETPL
ncbi:uncharacterized protein LOC135351892 isoform X2 [Halichondria panicea]|uniref:uncharacterized protein LOC135351892 isoform X2 n=1 Tax=Halichondria panicea TaxID=6063 RepID=UPI00312BA7A4